MSRRPASLFAVVLFACALAVAAPPSGKRLITDKDLFDFNWVANAQVSPDGIRVAFVRVTVDEKKTGYSTSIWVVPIDGSAEPTRLTAGPHDASPRWSPDGTRIAFLREAEKDGKPQPPQIYILQMSGGEPWPITDLPKGAESPVWSPDGKTLVFNSTTNDEDLAIAEKKKKEEPKPDEHESDVRIITRALYRANGEGYLDDKHPSHIWSIAVPAAPDQESEPEQLTTGIFDEDGPRWAPDGSRIYFTSTRVSEPYYNPEVLTIYWIAPGGGEFHKVTSMEAGFGGMAISPDGKWIGFEAAPSKPVVSYSETHFYVVSAEGGEPRRASPNFDHEVGGGVLGDMEPPRAANGYPPLWSPDGKALYEAVGIGGANNLMRFDVASGEVTPVTTGNHNIFEVVADSRLSRFVLLLSTPTTLLDLYSVVPGSQPVRLTHFNDKLFSQLELSEPEAITYTSFDGKKIEAWVYKPPDFDEHKKYPLILNIHGGPHTAYGYTFFHEFQWMAAKGYVVLAPNPRGSSNYGQELGNIIQYHYPGDDYKDLMAGVDELIHRGYIDEKKLGVTGGSGGGLLTDWTVTQTTRFAAAVAQRDLADWSAFWYTTDFTLFTPFWFRGAPWQDPQDFAARSPITHVANVKTPLMLILGDADYRTPPGAGGEQMFRALKFLHVPTVMVRFPRESHELSRSGEPWHRVERLDNILNWFDKYLQGKPMPQYDVPSEQPATNPKQVSAPPAARP